MTLSSGQRLGPYKIIAPLGVGGMGEIHRARDSRLGRDVAIKVLPESVAADREAIARFEREAKTAASLSHPNILGIHDFGTEDGVAFAVMELVDGETLRERLKAGPIPAKLAIVYVLQIARALSAVHERGVVLRELKPENLLVTRAGRLRILFGVAKKLLTSASGVTEPETAAGSIAYMSPEQVKGLPVDHRSDIFSFGALLYEMLSGKKAFARASSRETIAAILEEEPSELLASGRNVSPALQNIVRQCLVKDRDRRFQSMRDVAFALNEASDPAPSAAPGPAAPGRYKLRTNPVRLAAAAAVILAGAIGIYAWTRSGHARVVAGVKRIAVLPFENLGTPADDYFTDGIADAVRRKLASVPGIEVIASGSSMRYKKTAKTRRQIAGELDAPYLLTATVRWQKSGGGGRMEVRPKLEEVTDGAPASKWQEPFDGAVTEVFRIESDIAARVAQALGVIIGAADTRRLSEWPTQNLPAYDVFLKGEDASKGLSVDDPVRLKSALAFYEQAVTLDPGFAQAWAQLSRVALRLHDVTGSMPELRQRARDAAEKASALAPNRPETLLAAGNYQQTVLENPARALEEYAKGRALARGNADLLSSTAISEQILGRWDEAIEHYHQAERLDPRSLLTQDRLAEALFMLHRYPEARVTIDRGLALAPDSLYLTQLKAMKAMTFLAEGDLSGARAVLRVPPNGVEATALVAYVATYWGLVWALDGPQRELLLRLTPQAFDNDNGAFYLARAQAYALEGDEASARASAEAARRAIQGQLGTAPGDRQHDMLLALALAYLGRKTEAIREGVLGAEETPKTDTYTLPYLHHLLTRIYILVGEPEKALDELERLLNAPYFLSPGWLKIDPTFDPLRKNPRFQKLVSKA